MLDVFIDTPEMDEFVGKFSKEDYDFACTKLMYEQSIKKGHYHFMTTPEKLKSRFNINYRG